jgi:hypothetical protein
MISRVNCFRDNSFSLAQDSNDGLTAANVASEQDDCSLRPVHVAKALSQPGKKIDRKRQRSPLS